MAQCCIHEAPHPLGLSPRTQCQLGGAQGSPVLSRNGRGGRVQEEGSSLGSQYLPGSGVPDVGRGGPEGSLVAPRGSAPRRERSVTAARPPGSPSAPFPWSPRSCHPASLAALSKRGGGSKIRERQFDVSNKASLHFAKLILTPIIICCRSGRVLPTAA